MAYICILIATIYIASFQDFMYGNITGVASIAQYRPYVIGYTLFCTLFFAYKIDRLYQKIPSHTIYRYIIFINVLFMTIASFCPYQSPGTDIYSCVHVYGSMISSLSLLVLLFIYTRKLSYTQYSLYQKVHHFFDLGLQFLCLFLIVFTRVNGYIEILFTFFVCSYLYILEKK